jgi:hypothetical protein
MKNIPLMVTKHSSNESISSSELYKDLQAQMDALINFEDNMAAGMDVINSIPKTKAMIIPHKHIDLGPVIEEAKRLLQNNIDRLQAISPDAQAMKKQEKLDQDAKRLADIKAKLEILYNYEKNPALGIETLKTMPVYAEKMASGKGVNMSKILAEAIDSTKRIVDQLERTKKNNP